MRLGGVLFALVATLALSGSGGAGVPVPPPPGDGWPTWSPDGSAIVFLSTREGTTLRVIDPDGSGERQIPWLPASTSHAFSPDWSHIAARSETASMVVERLDGSDRVDLGFASYGTKPSWSPDGTRVTYYVPTADPNSTDVVVARIDGSEARRIVRGIQPAWSPVGDRIAYLAGEPGSWQLHVIRPDGTGDVRVTARSGFSAPPSWSPDGTAIATALPNGALQVIAVADGRPAATVASGGVYSEFAWSPRGDAIAFANGAGVQVFDLSSGRTRSIAPSGIEPAWSPDGRQLAFAAGGQCRNRMGIYRVAVDRPEPARLTNDCRIVGTEGDDVLKGTQLADVIVGLGGDDRLTAVPSYFVGDTLEGDAGDDALLGSVESDTLEGGAGADVLRGGPGPDLLDGGSGRDNLHGDGGRDLIYARDGEVDTVSCGTNGGPTVGPEGDAAYVDRIDRVAADCEYVYRPGAAPPVRGRISLVIRVWPKGNRTGKTPPRVYTLRCRPAGGTLPRSASACARLIRIQNPFAPVPPATACAQIYGGSQTAGVRGVYGGRIVRATFSRQSSCEIKRWDRIGFLFPLR
jgi:Tol biopolymer transport system component